MKTSNLNWASVQQDDLVEISTWLTSRRNEDFTFFLDSSYSADGNDHLSSKCRYSYIGINPIFGLLAYRDHVTLINVALGNKVTVPVAGPQEALEQLEALFQEYEQACNPHFPEREPQWFTGFSYEFGRNIVGSGDDSPQGKKPLFFAWLTADQVVIDWHRKQSTYWSVHAEGKALKERYRRLFVHTECSTHDTINSFDAKYLVSKDDFISSVEKIRTSIFEGDVYLTNMTHPFYFKSNENKVDIYQKLRRKNPAPFGAMVITPDVSILSSSPERFIYVNDGSISTEPIKGTRPRGVTPEQDKKNYLDLLDSVKEMAEHTMVVDLLRNEIGKICKYGSVNVEESFYIEKYKTVFQLVSRVAGKLLPETRLKDIIVETFPGGSITGSPKYSAMNIIDSLEGYNREYYTGCLGRRSVSGESIDLSILIRSIFFDGNDA
ncbi:anthranilate synthase component I family protein [Enterovibrio coralii]|uniref:Aminobenzoate synthetase n=1 Tax=Enterovibrio coralii TaxID=294935 RepID=A0A135I4Z8_9GAMM|nr:anthranilate synthase component I family protein [Enterovibrio coralii]KXF80529.1 hypothetical protein ATN88_07535 [Enterovibrio coralii]